MYWSTVFAISCFKLLLLPAYHSTDFEVHRNWLALTHSLPFHKWYYENTSEWTLDYPPFFAWFEWTLSKVAAVFDVSMLNVNQLSYASPMTVLFQRLSVIITDLILAYAAKLCAEENCVSNKWRSYPLARLALVVHIFMMNITILPAKHLWNGQELEGAFWFSVLLNLKHIYLYIAPAYFVYLLRSYCFTSNSNGQCKYDFLSLDTSTKQVRMCMCVCLSFYSFDIGERINRIFFCPVAFYGGLGGAFCMRRNWQVYNYQARSLDGVSGRPSILTTEKKASLKGTLHEAKENIIILKIYSRMLLILVLMNLIPVCFLASSFRNPRNPMTSTDVLGLKGLRGHLSFWSADHRKVYVPNVELGLRKIPSSSSSTILHLLSLFVYLFPLL
ncbi:unnamed protein product, partial [Meganyctiphanes norvegica]